MERLFLWLSIAIAVFVGVEAVCNGAPFLSSDPAQVDGYEFLIDQGEWVPCQVDAGKMKCNLGSLPLGGHLLRGRALVSGKESEGKAWLYVFKKRWYGMDLYYVLKMDGENISWEVQAIK